MSAFGIDANGADRAPRMPITALLAAADAGEQRAAAEDRETAIRSAEEAMIFQAREEHARIVSQRDLREADAMQAVLRAKGHDGRADGAVTEHDAATARLIADLLHMVAGRSEQVRASGGPAVGGAASSRRVDPGLEAGVAASAGK